VEGSVSFSVVCSLSVFRHLKYNAKTSGHPDIQFLKAMHAEHCTMPGCERPFTSSHNKITTPKIEWALVNDNKSREPKFKTRRIPDIDQLEQLDSSVQARLKKFEIIAVVMYTGPMVLFPICDFDLPTLSGPQ
jgi:hypothetical protein